MPLDLGTFTLIHVILSVVGILTGLVVVGGFVAGAFLSGWVGLFLTTTILTSITGFGFPFVTVLPSHIVGVLSLLVLAVALAALYWKQLEGGWRQVFVISSTFALYLNAFVLIAQLLQKTPILAKLAPGPNAPAFGATQGLVLALFLALGWVAVKGFRGQRTVFRTSLR